MDPRGKRRLERRRLTALASCLVAALLGGAASGAEAANKVFYTNYQGSKISFANLDGSGSGADLNTTGATMNLPTGTAIDIVGNKVYWPNENPAADTISYANLDGSGAGGDLTTTGATVEGPNGIAIDPPAGKIYWANVRDPRISAANLDGSGGADLDTTGATVAGARGVALDEGAGRLYWANFDAGLSFANTNGTGAGGNLVTTGATVSGPIGVAIDPTSGRIYWANGTRISYANLDGTGGGNVITTGATVSGPVGVAVDPYAGRVYWANQGGAPGHGISYANLDGSGGDDIATTGATVNGAMYPSLLKQPRGSAAPVVSESGGELLCSEGEWAPDLLGAFLYQVPQHFDYQWTRNGADIPGAGQSTYIPEQAGTYRCRVSAVNQAGTTSQTSDAFTVQAPTIADLIASVEALNLPSKVEGSLLAKLSGAQRNLDAGKVARACDALASFIDQVKAQRKKKVIPAAAADELIAEAEAVRTSLGCA